MFNLDIFTNENNAKHNLKWPYIPIIHTEVNN